MPTPDAETYWFVCGLLLGPSVPREIGFTLWTPSRHVLLNGKRSVKSTLWLFYRPGNPWPSFGEPVKITCASLPLEPANLVCEFDADCFGPTSVPDPLVLQLS
jgi:hypothetical protein